MSNCLGCLHRSLLNFFFFLFSFFFSTPRSELREPNVAIQPSFYILVQVGFVGVLVMVCLGVAKGEPTCLVDSTPLKHIANGAQGLGLGATGSVA